MHGKGQRHRSVRYARVIFQNRETETYIRLKIAKIDKNIESFPTVLERKAARLKEYEEGDHYLISNITSFFMPFWLSSFLSLWPASRTQLVLKNETRWNEKKRINVDHFSLFFAKRSKSMHKSFWQEIRAESIHQKIPQKYKYASLSNEK